MDTKAAQEYRDRQAAVGTQIDTLLGLLGQHGDKQAANTRNYGFVGDLAYVSEQLGEIIAFLR